MFPVLLLIKPDAFERHMVGHALDFLERADVDLEINEARLFHQSIPTAIKLSEHYAEHRGKGFYDGLISFMTSGRILAISAKVKDIREIRSCIAEYRKVYGKDGPRNLIHCSDSEEAGEREIRIWFPS